jgi:hypothetical protein
MAELCLTILCPPPLAEQVLDTLLTMPEILFFTSSPASAHGLDHSALSATEQVLGLAKMTRIDALLVHAVRDQVMSQLSNELAGSRLKFWIAPVVDAGEIS